MRNRGKRAAVDPVTLIVLGAAALLLMPPNWRPTNWAVFQKKPPTQQLGIAQADLDKAKAEAEAAQRALQAMQEAEKARTAEQLRYAQQMAAGAAESLASVPPAANVPQVQLAAALIGRTNTGLEAALGKLPPALQVEISRIVAQSLSQVQAELDAARAALAVRDRELAVAVEAKQAIAAQIPKLQAEVKAKDETLAVHVAKVAEKTSAVVQFAEKAALKEREAGSLRSQLSSLGCIAVGLAVLYVGLTIILPGFIKYLDGGWLKTSLRNVAGYLTNPLLFHDAKKKLKELTIK